MYFHFKYLAMGILPELVFLLKNLWGLNPYSLFLRPVYTDWVMV